MTDVNHINGLDNRRQRELACTTEVFKYLQSYFPSALISLLAFFVENILLVTKANNSVNVTFY